MQPEDELEDRQPEDEELDLWPMVPRLVTVDPQFHSLELDGPFTHCKVCETELVASNREYFVERIFRGTEPIVEYAMCLECQRQLSSELSEESMQAIQRVFGEIDFDRRSEDIRDHLVDGSDSQSIAPWLDRCLLTGKRRDACNAYQIGTLCLGAKMQLSVLPFMLSDEAVELIVGVISRRTRDKLEEFMGDRFGMPPEFCESPDFFPIPL